MSFFTISSTIQSDNELRDIAWEYHKQLTAPSSQSCHQIVIACSLKPWLEKAMASHSSTLAWKIPWKEEPGRLQSMGLRRVRHDWATSLSLFTSMQWRRKWQPTPVFLPGESHGRRSLVGCSPWGHEESDTTEQLHFTSVYVKFCNHSETQFLVYKNW